MYFSYVSHTSTSSENRTRFGRTPNLSVALYAPLGWASTSVIMTGDDKCRNRCYIKGILPVVGANGVKIVLRMDVSTRDQPQIAREAGLGTGSRYCLFLSRFTPLISSLKTTASGYGRTAQLLVSLFVLACGNLTFSHCKMPNPIAKCIFVSQQLRIE